MIALVRVFSVIGLFAASSSLVRGSVTCDVTVPSPCQDVGFSQSKFPNDFGHLTASTAEWAMNATFGSISSSDECSPEIATLACLLYFPDCRPNNAIGENVVRRPCRDYCERVQADCPDLTAIRDISCVSYGFWDPRSPTACFDPFHLVVINEVDIGDRWFVELWDYGMGDMPLKDIAFSLGGLTIARSHQSLNDLKTRSNGYFVIGGPDWDEPVDVEEDSLPDSGHSFMMISRAPFDRISRFANVPEIYIVDAVIYENELGSPSLPNLNILPQLSEKQETLLDDSPQNESISRCVNFRPLTSSAFYLVSTTPGASNACAQKHFETKITAKVAITDNCCDDTSVFCAFNLKNENPEDGYCQGRKLVNDQTTLTASRLRSADCYHTPESLAIIQPLLEENILVKSCPIASTERARATLISRNDGNMLYSSVERSSAENALNCSFATTADCEINLVSNLINNSTSKINVIASCDGQNVIGFTVANRDPCLGTMEFPCTSGKPWKIVTLPESHVTGVILKCPEGISCSIFSESNPAILDEPNDSNEYVFGATPLPIGSFFTLEFEFTVELYYDDDLKIAIDFPVLQENEDVYLAFALIPSQGVYTVRKELGI